jgi:hypothetical protein
MTSALQFPRSDGSAAGWFRPATEHALWLLLIALLAFAALVTSFVFRASDDNRLTSWQWVFADVHVARFAALIVSGIALAYALRKVALPPRSAGSWLFVSSFAAGAAFWSEPEVIVDAARYFVQAKYLALYGIGAFVAAWGSELPAWTDLPLVPFLYGLIFRLAGEERIYIQVFTTLLFAGTVVLTYRIGRELWDATLGFYGAALLLAMPYLLTQVPLMLADVPAMFFIALAVFTTIKTFKLGGAAWIAAAVAAVTLALLSKYSTWLMLTVLIPVFLVYAREAPAAALRRAGVIVGLAAALFGLLLLAKPDVMIEQFRLLWDYQRPGLGRWQESFVSTFLFQVHPFIAAAAAWSLYAAIRRKDLKYAIIGWLLALALLGGIERIRYLIVLFPMLALMAAYGLREIRNGEARAFAAFCAVACSLVVAWFAYLPFLQTASAANLRQAGAYLDGVDSERVEVITLEQARVAIHPAVSVPLLDLFTRKPLAYRPDLTPFSPPAGIDTSPLRFTWEYPLPGYYRAATANPEWRTTVALILGDPSQPLPPRVAQRLERHCLASEFMASEGVYRYQTLVRIYQPASLLNPRCPHGGIE